MAQQNARHQDTEEVVPQIPSTSKQRELSVLASVDPRTLMREIRQPGSVMGMAGDRIRKVLVAWRRGEVAT